MMLGGMPLLPACQLVHSHHRSYIRSIPRNCQTHQSKLDRRYIVQWAVAADWTEVEAAEAVEVEASREVALPALPHPAMVGARGGGILVL